MPTLAYSYRRSEEEREVKRRREEEKGGQRRIEEDRLQSKGHSLTTKQVAQLYLMLHVLSFECSNDTCSSISIRPC